MLVKGRTRTSFLLILAAVLQSPIAVALAAGPQANGQIQLTFKQASPQSDVKIIRKHMGATKAPTDAEIKEAEYDPAHDSLDAYTPPIYRPDGTWGLFVWVGVTDPSPEWMPVLARHKFLFVSAKPHDEKVPYYHPRRELDAVFN